MLNYKHIIMEEKSYCAEKALLTVILFMSLFFIVLMSQADKEQKLRDAEPWRTVTVVSRVAIIVPCGFGSETEVELHFSDGTSWSGSSSRSGGSEYKLLYVQKGQQVQYKFNHSVFADRIWKVE